jgi:hypothetical protein
MMAIFLISLLVAVSSATAAAVLYDTRYNEA